MFRLATLIGALMFCASAAEAAWHKATSEHFVIYSEQGADDLREFATRLERFDAAVRSIRGMDDPYVSPANRLTVFVVDNTRVIGRLVGRNDRRGVAGFYVPRASGSYAFVPRRSGDGSLYSLDADTVFFHEYTHHLMLNYHGSVYPTWYVEGFAEFFSTAKFERSGAVGLGTPANHRAYGLVLGRSITLEDVLRGIPADYSREQYNVFYGRAWLLTHFLTFTPERRGQLDAYLKAVQAGEDSIAAGQRVFGDLKQLDRQLDRYLQQRRMQYIEVSGASLAIDPIDVRPLTAAEAAIIELRMRSKRGVDDEGARELLPLVRRAAAGFPADPFVQTTLAEAEFDARNYAEAEAAADRALASDPKWAEAMIYKGMIKMRLAPDAEDAEAAWRDARRWFIAAANVDPDDPEPKMYFYQTFTMSGAEPTANAKNALYQAHLLAPHDFGLRFMAGRQFLLDGEAAEARRALAPIASNPHGGSARDQVLAVLAALDRGDTKAALAALQGAGETEPDGES